MPSKHMLPKGKRRQSVRAQYRIARDAALEAEAAVPVLDLNLPYEGNEPAHNDNDQDVELDDYVRVFTVEGDVRTHTADADAAGMRLDAYLAQAIPDISRARVQMLIEAGQVRVNGAKEKAKLRLGGGERIEIEGEPRPEPLHATPEDIPLDVLYEDEHLAIINKAAGMTVHAGAGSTDDARNRGTLVNALLYYMNARKAMLSQAGGELRPGIVHRLDKQTSGAIVVAKDDVTHRKLSEMFAAREVKKTYIALAHGLLPKDDTTVDLPIARDLVRRIRMTTRRPEGRNAVSHVHVLERIRSPYGEFTLAEVKIETGRTHQIRVHLQALGHPIVGDTLYGAPHRISQHARGTAAPAEDGGLELGRNFLHAANLEFVHPRTGKKIAVDAPLAAELGAFLAHIGAHLV